jgi:tRNA A37 methylthiotransferase MiaB
VLFNSFIVYRTLNTNKTVKYKKFLHKVGRSWTSEVQNRSESSSNDLQLPKKQTTPRGPKKNPPGRLSGDFRVHKLEKMFAGVEVNKKYPARQRKVCAAHKKQSGTRNICTFCVVQLHKGSCFEKYHSVMNY